MNSRWLLALKINGGGRHGWAKGKHLPKCLLSKPKCLLSKEDESGVALLLFAFAQLAGHAVEYTVDELH